MQIKIVSKEFNILVYMMKLETALKKPQMST